MFKLMIVDDSPYILQDISQLIDWEAFDFMLIGSYTSASRLLTDAAVNMPDLVITDVSMPVMDGIELASKLYKLNPNIKIIFISSYAEFEYARRAVELHVFDYLLKPVQISNLTEVMNRLLKHLKDEERQRYQRLSEESKKEFFRKSALTHYLSRLLFHVGNEETIRSELQQLGFILSDSYHLYVSSITPPLPADSYIYFLQSNRFPDIQLFPLVTDTEQSILLILYSEGDESTSIEDFLSYFCIDAETQLKTSLTICYSNPSSSFAQLPQLYEQSLQALASLLQTKSSIPLLAYRDIHTEDSASTELASKPTVCNQYVIDMQNYIHENYMYDITTKDVAKAVHLSSNYANSLFCSECSITIFNYLTEYRIHKAKELLTQTDIYITKIAELVGYGSKTSFYLAFKRQVGISPTEYRQKTTDY